MGQATRYKRGIPGVVLNCLIVFLSVCTSMFGQAPPADNKTSSPTEGEHVFQLKVTLVLVDIEVRDGYHGPVSDLTVKDFSVFEDGKEQEIQFFQRKDLPDSEAAPGHYQLGYYPPSIDGEYKKVRVRFRDAEVAKGKGLGLAYSPKGYFAIFRD